MRTSRSERGTKTRMNAVLQGLMTVLLAAHAVSSALGGSVSKSVRCSRDVAHAGAQSQRGAFVERQHCAEGPINFGSQIKKEREAFHYQQRVTHGSTIDLNRRFYIGTNFCDLSANANNVGG